MERPNPLVVVENVSYQYPQANQLALHNVSVEIHEGEFVGVIGPTGAGKTTLCLSMNGIIPHTIKGDFSGTVYVDGESTAEKEVHEISEKLGLILQNPEAQLFSMTVEEELAFGPENLGVAREEIGERVAWALELVGMERFREAFPDRQPQ